MTIAVVPRTARLRVGAIWTCTCADPNGLGRFWCSVLDYEVEDEDEGIVTIGAPMVPEGRSHLGPVPPTLTFAFVPEDKPAENRLQLETLDDRCDSGGIKDCRAPASIGHEAAAGSYCPVPVDPRYGLPALPRIRWQGGQPAT